MDAFIKQFRRDRNILMEFYKRIPIGKLDYHMVHTTERISDSPRESILHIIKITRNYTDGLKSGRLQFTKQYDDLSHASGFSKEKLLLLLSQSTDKLLATAKQLQDTEHMITVPWSKQLLPAHQVIWGLDSHDILHQGWNLAIMDHLGMERFSALKKVWG